MIRGWKPRFGPPVCDPGPAASMRERKHSLWGRVILILTTGRPSRDSGVARLFAGGGFIMIKIQQLKCPGCGAPVHGPIKECEYCGGALTSWSDHDKVLPARPTVEETEEKIKEKPRPIYTAPPPRPPLVDQYRKIPDVPTYMLGSILVACLFCLPTGLVAVYYSAQVSSRMADKDYPGAKEMSGNAVKWQIISFVGLVVFWTYWLVFHG